MSIFGRTQEPVSSENAILYVNPRRCPQNHPCPAIRVCPTNALSQRGYGLPQVDMEKCIRCGKCVRYCPMGALELRQA
jgi:Fe-S-cluster-containing hydrogenase component 2